MARRDDGMVDVELVGDPRVDDGPGPRARRESPAGGTPRGRAGRTAVPAGIAVVVAASLIAGGIATTRSDARRDDALVAAYAEVPGIAPSLRDPLGAPWRAFANDAAVADLAVLREPIDGRTRTVARDLASGEVRWVLPDSVDRAGRGARCPSAVHDGTLLLCEVAGEPGEGGPTTDAVLGGTPDRLVVLRADDGTVLGDRELGSSTIGWVAVGDDVVVARREGTAAVIERSAVPAATPVWAAEVPVPPGVLARDLDLHLDDGLVVLSGPGAAVVTADSGDVLGSWAAPEGSRLPVQILTSAVGFAVWRTPAGGVWFNRAGSAGARVPGAPLEAAVDDGAHPQVILVQDGGVLRAVDIIRGVLWERPVAGDQFLAVRLDDLAVIADHQTIRVIDLLSGGDLWWTEPGIGWMPGTRMLTDGVRLLVPGYEVSAGRTLTALDLRDGSRHWTTPRTEPVAASSGTDHPVTPGNQLVVFD